MAAKKKAAKTKAKAKKKVVAAKSVVKKKAVGTKKAVSKKAPVKTAAAVRKKVVTTKKAPAKKKVVAKSKRAAVQTPAARPARTKTAAARKPAAKPRSAAARGAVSASSHAGPVPGIAPYHEDHGEEYMSEAQVEHFRNILRAWKRDLMEEVDRTVHHMQDEAANFPDPNDRATQESEFSMELRARDRERKLIKKIDESLMNLDNDEYGYCEACGVEIGIRRLEARPTATLCIDCKTLDEIREKQMG